MKYDWIYLIKQLRQARPDLCISSEDEICSLINDFTLHNEDLMEAFAELSKRFGESMRLSDHVIFLFGNGASMYAGSRSTMSFSLKNYIEEPGFNCIKSEVTKISDSVRGGIEDQLNALNAMAAHFNSIKDDREEYVLRLIRLIKHDLIADFVNSLNYDDLSLHKMMFNRLTNFGVLSRTQIYTTNYDLAFEYIMDLLDIEYTDGFLGFVNRHFDSRVLAENGKPLLVKLHGSVNWINENDRIKEIQPMFKEGRLRLENTDPVLIYPTSDKLYQTFSAPYSELLRHMLDEMENGSNTVVVLGYKYGDDHINETLFQALNNSNNRFYFFIYGDPDECAFIRKVSSLKSRGADINILSGYVLPAFNVFVTKMLPLTENRLEN